MGGVHSREGSLREGPRKEDVVMVTTGTHSATEVFIQCRSPYREILNVLEQL